MGHRRSHVCFYCLCNKTKKIWKVTFSYAARDFTPSDEVYSGRSSKLPLLPSIGMQISSFVLPSFGTSQALFTKERHSTTTLATDSFLNCSISYQMHISLIVPNNFTSKHFVVLGKTFNSLDRHSAL